MVTQQELKKLVKYDPETGLMTRLTSPCNSVKVGDEIGYQSNAACGLSYRKFEWNGVYLQVHRMAWLYMTGDLPAGDIDHIDGNGLNNKWSNLRCVTKEQNSQNRKLNCNNVTGQMGVSYFKQTGKWRAAINIGKVKKHIGYFDSMDDAIMARKKYEKAHNYHHNHGRSAA